MLRMSPISVPASSAIRFTPVRTPSAGSARLVQHAVDLAGVARAGPVADDAFDLLLVLAAREVRREAGVVGELRLSHGLAQAPEDVVGVRSDDHPLVVLRLEDVRRSDPLQ